MPTKKPKIEELSDTRPPIEELSDSRPGIEELSDQPPQEDLSYLDKAINVVDIPFSFVRTGIEAGLSPEKEVLPELGKQFEKTIESPTEASMYAPRGPDINKLIKTEVFGQSAEELQKAREEYPQASRIIEGLGGFVTETALESPINLLGSVRKVRRIVNAPLTYAADRQAARALAKYATKSTADKGADVLAVGKRLVEEDLQGKLTDPAKLYEHLAGKVKIDKINPDSLNTLKIVKSKKTKGLVGEVSDGLTKVIDKVKETTPELQKKTYPLDTLLSIVRKNVAQNADKISGKTVNLDQVGKILEDTLKPFEEITTGVKEIPYVKKQPGSLELSEGVKLVKGEPVKKISTLNISEAQQLRKNIGKLISDREFYAAADDKIRVESEVLKDVYRELGKVIKSDLDGIKVRVGRDIVDAGDFFETQNNRMKGLMDVESFLEYTPQNSFKKADLPATLLSMISQGGVMGGTALAGEMMGVPYSSTAGLLGAGTAMSMAAGSHVKKAAPEYLSSIFATAAKVPPTAYPRIPGTIQYMKEGKPVGREPQSIVELSPKELINYKIPRTTEAMIQSKGTVIAKLAQSGIPEDMLKAVNQALNGDKETLSNVASLVSTQFPDLFERSKYKIFDGKFLDANDAAKAADDISRRDNLNSIQKAKMINQINKHQTVPEGL